MKSYIPSQWRVRFDFLLFVIGGKRVLQQLRKR